MPNAEWGVKRVCPKTGKRFFDLNKNPIISPYTGEVVEVETHDRRSDLVAAAKPKPAKPVKEDADDLLVDEDDSIEVDDELLEDDDDDTVALDDLADVAEDDD